MPGPRHKARHKPDSTRRRLRGLAAPGLSITLVLATCTGAVAWRDSAPETTHERRAALTATETPRPDVIRANQEIVSRSSTREPLRKKPAHREAATSKATSERAVAPADRPEVVDHLYMTTALNVWTGPGEEYSLLEVLPAGTKVAVSGVVEGQWAEIVQDGEARWVNVSYLVEEKPKPEPEPEPTAEEVPTANEEVSGLSDAPCASGSSVEAELTPDAVAVHRAVCARYPEVTSYGGIREGDDGEHGDGRALDIMISDSALGDEIAEWVRANSQSLGVSELLWSQQIWTVERSSEGWRWMEDRGSDTANHYDHVHVTVYGDSGG